MGTENSLKNNTLFNEIIRIDLFKIENLSKVLDKLDAFSKKYNFKFRTNDVKSVNISIDDPETLLTQEMIKANIDETQNYEYVSQNEKEKFVVNEYFLIFEKSGFDGYTKIDEYINLLIEMFNIIISVEKDIKISRIGIRKMNHLFVNDISKISEYVQYVLPTEDYETIDEYSIMQKNLSTVSSNINFTLKKGKHIKNNQDEGVMYRLIWDIDCYTRTAEIIKVCDTIKELNAELFARYNRVITDELRKILCEENLTEEELISKKIYGGINKNG